MTNLQKPYNKEKIKSNNNSHNSNSPIYFSTSSDTNPDIFEYLFFKKFKITEGKNKKVISTSVFLPQNPSISFKTTFYIVGLIKNVERFHKIMPNGWKFRIYYDSMFDDAIKSQDIEDAVKVDERSLFTANMDEDFKKYKYDSSVYKSKSRNSPSTKKIKTSLKKNLVYIKKMVKLFQIYINFIKISKLEKYKNIELVSYNCPSIKKRGILGHPSTFGSMMRFMPLFDDTVETFCCVNSRGYITPIMRDLFDELHNKPEKKVLAVKYSSQFMKSWGFNFMKEKIMDIKQRLEKGKKLKKSDEIFSDIINGILSFKDDFFNLKKPFNLTIDKIKYSARSGMARYTDIYSIPNFRDIEGVFNDIEGLKSIAAGIVGLKKTNNFIETRKYLFNKFLVYLLQDTIQQFDYGIDELAIVYCILPDVGLCNSKYGNENTTTFGFDLIKNITEELKNYNEYDKEKVKRLVKKNKSRYHFYNFHKSNAYILFEGNTFMTGDILCGRNKYLETKEGNKLCYNSYLKSHFSSYFNLDFTEHFSKSGVSFLLFYNGLLESKKLFEVRDNTRKVRQTKKFKINNKIILDSPNKSPSIKEVFYMCISKDLKNGYRGIDVTNMQHSFNEYKTLVLINENKESSYEEKEVHLYFNHPIEIKGKSKSGKSIKKDSTIGKEFYHILNLDDFNLKNINLLMKEIIQHFSNIIENKIRYINKEPSEYLNYYESLNNENNRNITNFIL